mgnify:CR=1 FL=1
MYIVSYGTESGYYEQEFETVDEAVAFIDDMRDEVNNLHLESA